MVINKSLLKIYGKSKLLFRFFRLKWTIFDFDNNFYMIKRLFGSQ